MYLPPSLSLVRAYVHFASHKEESYKVYKFKCQSNPSKMLLRKTIFTDLLELYASHPPL